MSTIDTNIDCVNCKNCSNCVGCVNVYGAEDCFYDKNAIWIDGKRLTIESNINVYNITEYDCESLKPKIPPLYFALNNRDNFFEFLS